MRLKDLESRLQDLEGFRDPKVALEQYQTPPHVAARVLHTVEASYGDLRGKAVADLGCGCGMLTVGSSLLGATTFGFDVDDDALDLCRENLEAAEVTSAELLLADVLDLRGAPGSRFEGLFDAVVLNPPFGTKGNKGADVAFLEAALRLSKGPVYSLHKTATRGHIVRKAAQWGVECRVLAQIRYDLPSSYRFHKKTSVDIEVDFIRLSHK